ncbi:hypothetical protein SAMN02745115_01643 [[Eubacterium] yurii]|jgi:hypothetical protein|nr:MAG: hypothetical protein D8H95_01060 [Lachnospiraceae bacterium]SKC58858.1 hypothetical protein SAMN02745115_01643 [[Eubacterium] yurii]
MTLERFDKEGVFMAKKSGLIKKIIGGVLIFIGILGCILPVLPGFVFIILGFSFINEKFAIRLKRCNERYKLHKSKRKFIEEMIGRRIF